MKLADAKDDQTKFWSNVGEIRKGNKKNRSKEQETNLHKIEMLY